MPGFGPGSYPGRVTEWHGDDGAGRVAPRVLDVLLAVVVAVVLSAIIAVSRAGGDAPANVIAYVFALGFGAVLLLRRQMPAPVVVLSVLGTFAYYTLGYPPIGVALPVVAALYSAAELGATRWAAGAAAVVFVVSLYFRVRDDPQPVGYVLGTDSVSNVALMAVAIALGYGIRARRLRAAQQRRIDRLIREQSAREAELRVQSERESISRELHDTLGHALSVIALHASVGSEAVGRDDRAVVAALDRVREQSTASLRELRSMLRLLRAGADNDGTRHVRSLADVQAIIDEAKAAGVDVTADIDVAVHDLPAAVDAAAYRVIQESLTNILRHAHATTARVNAVMEAGLLRITVADDGRGTAGGDRTGGYGITGMTERVRLLGGSLSTRSAPGAGFTIEATIPARLAS
ncbi:histidine kinase [Streptosporangium nondiastaticum]